MIAPNNNSNISQRRKRAVSEWGQNKGHFEGEESFVSRNSAENDNSAHQSEDDRQSNYSQNNHSVQGYNQNSFNNSSNNKSQNKQVNNSKIHSGKKENNNNSFGSEGIQSANKKSKTNPYVNKAHFHPLSSLAEENLVKNFNKLNPRSRANEACLQTNKPQRIELPLFFNTPVRDMSNSGTNKMKGRSLTLSHCKDQLIPIPQDQQLGATKLNYSFNQFSQFTSLHNPGSYPKNPIESEEVQKQIIAEKHVFLRSLRRRKDYEILAFACKRAGKPRDEGRSYYSIGVLNDNIGKYKLAIKNYEKFLQICQNIGDQHGEALAYNCLGVDYQMLGEIEKKDTNDSSSLDKSEELFEKAIKYHKLHENIADVNGKFLACINLGLCNDALQRRKQALVFYQQALRHSVKMSNLASQTIAIGNIGRIGMAGLLENKEKMTVFIDKYIKLAHDINDKGGELKAQLKMGQVTSLIGDFQAGRESFLKALELAENRQDSEKLQEAKCGFAVSNAELQMQNYLLTYVKKMEQPQVLASSNILRQNFIGNDNKLNQSYNF